MHVPVSFQFQGHRSQTLNDALQAIPVAGQFLGQSCLLAEASNPERMIVWNKYEQDGTSLPVLDYNSNPNIQ